MPNSIDTQVSPISAPEKGKAAREALAGFLRYTVDTPDWEKAKAFVSRRTAAAGDLNTAAVPAGATYTLGAEESDELGMRIAVRVKGPSIEVGGQTQDSEEVTVPVVVIEEEGQWRIDLPATMERMLGGAAEAVGQAMAAMGDAMVGAVSAIQEGFAGALGTSAGSAEPARRTEAAARPKQAAKTSTKKAPPKPVKKNPAKKAAGKKPPQKPAKKAAPKKATRAPAKKAKPVAKAKPKKKPPAKKSIARRKPAKKRRR